MFHYKHALAFRTAAMLQYPNKVVRSVYTYSTVVRTVRVLRVPLMMRTYVAFAWRSTRDCLYLNDVSARRHALHSPYIALVH